MAIVRWEPFRDIGRFFEDDMFFPPITLPKTGWDLAVDVYEEGGSVIAEMNLPGVDKDKIEVHVEDNVLRISGSRQEEKESKSKNYYSKEIRRGSFERSVRLPAKVKGKEAKANYSNGVLKVTIPKESDAGGKVKVEVKS